MTTTTYTLTCLSPVHIGTGSQMSKFDGAYEDQQWHVIDLDAVLARGIDANELARAMSARDFDWATWLHQERIASSDVALYISPCSQDPGAVPIREAMKNHLQQPYLPGTSIKGALRTAILSQLLTDQVSQQTFATEYLDLCMHAQDLYRAIENQRAFGNANFHLAILSKLLGVPESQARSYQRTLYHVLGVRTERLAEARQWRRLQQQLRRLGHSREWLGQPIEHAVLGRDPNHDLMRALQVADSGPIPLEQLAIGLVWTYTLHGNRLVEKRESDGDYKAFVEWLIPDTSLRMGIRLDDFLFTERANRDLHFRDEQEQAVRHLAQTCNAYANALIASEKDFYGAYGLDALRDFYTELQDTLHALPEGAFLLNIGWGSGWEAKTLGDLLRTMLGNDDFRQLRQRYRLGMAPRTRQPDLDGPFPKTRRLGYAGGAPVWPMGWVKLTPQEA